MAEELLVLGAGFAGLWAALAAARRLDQQGVGQQRVNIRLVNRDAWHALRVRNYEADLRDARVTLAPLLRQAGIGRIEAEVSHIDVRERRVHLLRAGSVACMPLRYDRLVFALGSRLQLPAWPRAAQILHDVDTWSGAERLDQHLRSLSAQAARPGRFRVLVVGAGATGIEVATELATRVRAMYPGEACRILLADAAPTLGASLGSEAAAVVTEALAALRIEPLPGVRVATADEHGATLKDGTRIDACTIVWCGGLRAHPLTACIPAALDRAGRLPVDDNLRVLGDSRDAAHVYAAGDAAVVAVDATHESLMSCQHSRPMGRFAGHNAAGDLLGLAPERLQIPWYQTIVDLGAWGALHTTGWERRLIATGTAAKRTKQTINGQRIVPPRRGGRAALLAAAAPVIQAPPRDPQSDATRRAER